jgi:zinc transporter 5/7
LEVVCGGVRSDAPHDAGISHVLFSDPRLAAEASGGAVSTFINGRSATGKTKETVLESLEKQYRHVRATIKTILANPDSKKIYYFLCLNLAFMFVQMM